MNTLESNRKRIAAALVLAALVALPAIAEKAPAPEPDLATMRAASGGAVWAPRASFDKLVLTVKGGGFTISREFAGGQPYFEAVDPDGYTLPDGTYAWELTAVPRARRAGGGQLGTDQLSPEGRPARAEAAARGRVQSGAFTIVNGSIVDPGPAKERSAASRPDSRAAAAQDADDADPSNQ